MQRIFTFLNGPYNILLILLVLLFTFRTYTDHIYLLALWKPLLAAILLITIFVRRRNKKIRAISVFFAIPSVLFSWVNLWSEHPAFFILNAIATIVFLGISVSAVVYDVLLRDPVNFETLRGVICVYFLLGFAFAYFYYLVEYLSPGSIPITHTGESFSYSYYLSDMLYFSFLTFLMSESPITQNSQVQTAIILQGIFCQFYIAILVAKIVSVYAINIHNRSKHK